MSCVQTLAALSYSRSVLSINVENFGVVFVPPGFVESTPFVEKIKAFEQYFLSQIELYDKVR